MPGIFHGWLEKRYPASLDGAWARRWCVLDRRRGALSYYVDEGQQDLKGDIMLTVRSRIVAFRDSGAPGDSIKHRKAKPFGFVVDVDPELGKKRHFYYFSSPDENKLAQWIEAVCDAVAQGGSIEMKWRVIFECFDYSGDGVITDEEYRYLLPRINIDGSCVWLPPEEVSSRLGVYNQPMDYDVFSELIESLPPSDEHVDRARAMGNPAQRFLDCLYPDRAIIDVLTKLDQTSCQLLLSTYPAIFGDQFYDMIMNKVAEKDGWVCSNYWKKAIQGLLEPQGELWARAIHESMDGFGTDDFTLLGLVCTMPDDLRDEIISKYEELYGKPMCDTIESETSFDFKTILSFQTMDKYTRGAKVLEAAMQGLGTNEANLIRILLQYNFSERQELRTRYQALYGNDLIDRIQAENSSFFEESFRKALVQMLIAEEEEVDVDEACNQINEAMEGWGTDETALTRAICTKTPTQMQQIVARFSEIYDRSLFDFVKSETSRYYQELLLGHLRPPAEQLAQSVYDCLLGLTDPTLRSAAQQAGWDKVGIGTDDTGLCAMLVQQNSYTMRELRKTYYKMFDQELVEAIMSDTIEDNLIGGNYRAALLALIKPAPVTWAKGLLSAMKGLGTCDQLLINWMCIAKDRMGEVRSAFRELNKMGLANMIDKECSGDYKRTLVSLADRNTEDHIEQGPPYWAQRMRDAWGNVELLQDMLVYLPCPALDTCNQVFFTQHQKSLPQEIDEACDGGWFSFSGYWRRTMASLAEPLAGLYAKAMNEAMDGLGTDEYALTALVCTVPESICASVLKINEERYGTNLIDRIESETSFAYKKVLTYQLPPRMQSRAKALYAAMNGWGTSEDQLIRVTVCATMRERAEIRQEYFEAYDKDLVEHIQSETSGSFKDILVAIFECTERQEVSEDQLVDECNQLKSAMDGLGTDEATLIRILTSKQPDQLEQLKDKYLEVHLESLTERIDGETWYDFFSSNFREAIMLFMIGDRIKRLAKAVLGCIAGWGTDDTGLITCLVKLNEWERQELIRVYPEVAQGKELIDHIKGDTSGDYEKALLALLRPPPDVWADALISAMKGLGTSDELLINWMCIAKPRMAEVRYSFVQACKQLGYEYEAGPEDDDVIEPPRAKSEINEWRPRPLARGEEESWTDHEEYQLPGALDLVVLSWHQLVKCKLEIALVRGSQLVASAPLPSCRAETQGYVKFDRTVEVISMAQKGDSLRLRSMVTAAAEELVWKCGDLHTAHAANGISDFEDHEVYILPRESKLTALEVSGIWVDQGWGNQKGQCRVVLQIDGDNVAAQECPEVAQHSETPLNFIVEEGSGLLAGSEQISSDKRLIFQYLVGGGGGHELHITGLRIKIALGGNSSEGDSAIRKARVMSSLAVATNLCASISVQQEVQDDLDKMVQLKASKSQALAKWIEGECSGDYKGILMQLANLYNDY